MGRADATAFGHGLVSSAQRGALETGATLTIGDVLANLKVDFPDLTISKIRFLEDQGLVRPERTPVGIPQVLGGRRRSAAVRARPSRRTITSRFG